MFGFGLGGAVFEGVSTAASVAPLLFGSSPISLNPETYLAIFNEYIKKIAKVKALTDRIEATKNR